MPIRSALRALVGPLALALPAVALVGGCDAGSSPPAAVKESPQEAANRQKNIEDMYKSNAAQKKLSESTSKGAPKK